MKYTIKPLVIDTDKLVGPTEQVAQLRAADYPTASPTSPNLKTQLAAMLLPNTDSVLKQTALNTAVQQLQTANSSINTGTFGPSTTQGYLDYMATQGVPLADAAINLMKTRIANF